MVPDWLITSHVIWTVADKNLTSNAFKWGARACPILSLIGEPLDGPKGMPYSDPLHALTVNNSGVQTVPCTIQNVSVDVGYRVEYHLEI